MTENENSPENLRKFLESDDPAMVQMGLSMAKGSGVPEELLPTILRFYMWDEDKTVRAAAKSVFTKYAPAEIQTKVKENWKPNYRTLKPSALQDKFYSLSPTAKFSPTWGGLLLEEGYNIIHQDILIKMLPGKNPSHREWAAANLGEIGDERAVEALIKNFELEIKTWDKYYLSWNNQKNVRKVIENRKILQQIIAEALGQIGGERAIQALIVIQRYGRNDSIRKQANNSLEKLKYESKGFDIEWIGDHNGGYCDNNGNRVDAKLIDMISWDVQKNLPEKLE